MKKLSIANTLLLVISTHTAHSMLLSRLPSITRFFKANSSGSSSAETIDTIAKLFNTQDKVQKKYVELAIRTAHIVSHAGGPKKIITAGLLCNIGFFDEVREASDQEELGMNANVSAYVGTQWLKKHAFPKEILFYVQNSSNAVTWSLEANPKVITFTNHPKFHNIIALKRCIGMARLSNNKPYDVDWEKILHDTLENKDDADIPKDPYWQHTIKQLDKLALDNHDAFMDEVYNQKTVPPSLMKYLTEKIMRMREQEKKQLN